MVRAMSNAPAATLEELFARLAELGIRTGTVRHAAVFTVEEAKAQRGALPGAHVKNLFLRNKKGAMWLGGGGPGRRLQKRGSCV